MVIISLLYYVIYYIFITLGTFYSFVVTRYQYFFFSDVSHKVPVEKLK